MARLRAEPYSSLQCECSDTLTSTTWPTSPMIACCIGTTVTNADRPHIYVRSSLLQHTAISSPYAADRPHVLHLFTILSLRRLQQWHGQEPFGPSQLWRDLGVVTALSVLSSSPKRCPNSSGSAVNILYVDRKGNRRFSLHCSELRAVHRPAESRDSVPPVPTGTHCAAEPAVPLVALAETCGCRNKRLQHF